LNVEGLGSHLGDRAKQIRGSYDTFRANRDASISDIHDFVKQIPSLTRDYKALQTHINVVEQLKKTTDSRQFRERWNTERSILEGEVAYETIEDLICQQIAPMLALRFCSLQSVVSGGIRGQAKFDLLRRTIIHAYGFELLPTLHNLDKAGLFRKKPEQSSSINSMIAGLGGDASSTFAFLRKHLRLIVDDVDPVRPNDVAYVFSGYAPLSVRLVENPWTPQLLANLPGPAFDYRPADFTDRKAFVDLFNKTPNPLFDPQHASSKTAASASSSADPAAAGPRKTPPPPAPPAQKSTTKKTPLVVLIVGGATYAEIAAFRWLNKQPHFPYTVILAATHLLNGTTFVKSLVYEIENKLQRQTPAPSPAAQPPAKAR